MAFDINKIKGNMHNSTATIIGQMITAGAAMLSFFFVFQGYMISNFPTIIEKLYNIKFHSYNIGTYSLIIICIAVILFNIWSLGVIISLANGFKAALFFGEKLEEFDQTKNETNHQKLLFGSLNIKMKYLKGIPFFITCLTMFFICLIWVSFIIVVWNK